MASYLKRSGGWRAQVAIKGIRDTKTFSTKAEAIAWATERETALRKQSTTGIVSDKTLGQTFDRYKEEVSIHKAGQRWESLRLDLIGRAVIDKRTLSSILLCDITPDILGKWRDHRMQVDKVSGSTVNREFKLLSNVFTVARREWRWIESSPTTDVRRPKENKSRDKLYNDDEIQRISLALGFNESIATTKKQCVGIAFLFAIETAMRQSEICNLTKDCINGSVAYLKQTKNGESRHVPLSKRALELLKHLPEQEKDGTLFHVKASSAEAIFRRARTAAGVLDGTFHDTRHLAITRLAKKLNVLELARMVGHKDLNELRTYYNETAEELAKKL